MVKGKLFFLLCDVRSLEVSDIWIWILRVEVHAHAQLLIAMLATYFHPCNEFCSRKLCWIECLCVEYSYMYIDVYGLQLMFSTHTHARTHILYRMT